jgi:hypothetical protein
VDFVKISVVKAMLYFKDKLKVCICYIFHQNWKEFGTGDVHTNVLSYCEFYEHWCSKSILYLEA